MTRVRGCGRAGESVLTRNMNNVWDVFLTVYRGEIGDCPPGDPIGVPRHAYNADIRGRGEVLDCARSVSVPTSIHEGRTVQ